MAVTTFSRATSSVPGPAPSALHYYWPHASGLCHMVVWRPTAPFTGAPVALVVHGGLGYDPGMRAVTTGTIVGAKVLGAMQALSALGWVVISIDHPACSSNKFELTGGGAVTNKYLGTYNEISPVVSWPEQAGYLALAIQYIKGHWSAVAGSDHTPTAEELWGAGNSINPSFIHVYGNSWGATMAMYVALQPSGYFPFGDRLGLSVMDKYWPRASHRVTSVSFLSPQIDLTQIYVDTGVTSPLGVIYQDDRLQPFMRTESGRTWSGLPMAEKKKSPWWVLQENHAENNNLSFFGEFLGSGVGAGWDANLTAEDWVPGSVRDDLVGEKAWVDPHHGSFQGPPLLAALLSYGIAGCNMRKSVVKWAGADSEQPLHSSAQYITRFVAWLKSLGYPNT